MMPGCARRAVNSHVIEAVPWRMRTIHCTTVVMVIRNCSVANEPRLSFARINNV